MYDLRSQLMDKKPSTIILIPCCFQAPVTVVGESTVIEPFRCGTTRLSYSDGELAVPSKYLREVYTTQLQPFLKFCRSAEVHWVGRSLRSHRHRCFTCSAKRFYSLCEVLVTKAVRRAGRRQSARRHRPRHGGNFLFCGGEAKPHTIQLPGNTMWEHSVMKLDWVQDTPSTYHFHQGGRA